jgi:hypothetical protein
METKTYWVRCVSISWYSDNMYVVMYDCGDNVGFCIEEDDDEMVDCGRAGPV